MTTEPTRLHPQQDVTLDPADIRWRVGQISKKDAHKGSLLGYIDARTCMEALDRLDADWSAVHGDPIIVGNELIGVPCALTVNGVTRSDVGMPSSQEPIKGAYSDALKRAAVHFGIGRELYELPRIYVKLDDYKKPVAIPTYRNGRWTLPSGAGSVFYDREPDEQPERASKSRVGGATATPARPAPVQRTPEEQELIDQITALPGMSHARMRLLADAVGVPEGTHANVEQLRAILARATEQPSATVSADGDGAAEEVMPAPAAPDNPPSDGQPAAKAADPVAATVPPSGQDDSPRPSTSAAPAPTLDDVLAVTGGELVPPKPGTPEYRALPNGTERAQARKYWEARKDEPTQASLAEALGAPESDR